ncbi:hypothetical protein OG436_29670 [Streptomyces caniferus]|uniref:hypothetical protein n=1 Tax=Streptomyces caniferus TaxID=285557 RepID=UPI002E28DCCB|nr:hypothetical protein [Streptomyces caniferus]
MKTDLHEIFVSVFTHEGNPEAAPEGGRVYIGNTYDDTRAVFDATPTQAREFAIALLQAAQEAEEGR